MPNQVENNAPEGLIGKSMANKKKKAILLDEIDFFKYLFTYIANAVQSKNNPIKPVSEMTSIKILWGCVEHLE